jgi:dipeptidyl aminopeptidase/acylaminoacyl peptidase
MFLNNTPIFIFSLFICMNLTAQTVAPALPGDASLPSPKAKLEQLALLDVGTFKYKVADYFAKPKQSVFKISPNGKYISYKEKDAYGKRHVMVKERSTGKIARAIEEKIELISDYGWINDERLYYLMDKGGNENNHVYAVNIDGKNAKDLTPFDEIQAQLISVLKEQKNILLIQMNKNNKQVFEPYKLNATTGELTQLFENKDANSPADEYIFDKDGELRGYTKLVNGVETELYYKDLSTGDFKLIKKTKWDDTFRILCFNYRSDNKNEAYVATNLESDKTKIMLYDFKSNKAVVDIFSNPTFDASDMHLSKKRNYEIDYYGYEGEKQVVIPISQTYKELNQRVQDQFKGKQYTITGFDEDEKTFLVLIQSDKLYGTYYEYTPATGSFKLLMDLMPQLKEADMAEVRPLQFKSRDGLTIYGYITLPKETTQGKKVPLIVNPHGGPQGIRDSWGFNPEAQLFASRGYATLQVNFRISGGYGKQFLRAGFKQVGRKTMEDVEDGVQYAIEQGWADKTKVAIYGASHGGYATLMGLVKTPALYRCGVDYVGVSNIETFFNSFPEYWKPYKEIMKQIWYDLDKPEEAQLAKEVSPFYQVDKIKKPLLVVQGANDPRVKIAESDQMVAALRKKGVEVPYLVKYNEGHGFAREANQLELYRYMLGFFAKNFK